MGESWRRALGGDLLALLALLAPACSHETSSSGAAGEDRLPEALAATPVRSAPRIATRTPRSADPEVAELRRHLDRGQVEEARALLPALDRLGPDSAAEARLLLARFAALSRNVIDAIRAIEVVRKERPADPDVYATAAEIYVAAGKLDLGWDEVKAGEAACGEAPELSRARGILWISRSGGARRGLDLLEEARRADQDLPFLDRALSQAHLLVGKEDAAARKGVDALAHARLAASLDPDEIDTRRFLSEALVQNGDFEAGIAEIQRLVDRGQPLTSELALLHKKAGIAALLERDRTRAVLHFAAARKLGLTDAELSTGARILDEEAAAKVEQGIEAYRAGDLAAAKAGFRQALDLDPDRIQAKNHLAVALFKEADYPAAIGLWRAVLETAGKEALPLPEPVHLNLAQAEALSGDLDGARATLEDYLSREPGGRWAMETRAALLALPAKKSSH